MHCPTCHFENMPEQTACARCGAALSASGGLVVEFMPPRAGGKKAWYPLLYRLNAAVDGYREWTIWRILAGLTGDDGFPARALLLTALSAVPGLGHWKGGRRRAAKIAFSAWLALALVAANAFGSDLTGATIGLLVGWHAVVMFDAGLRRHLGAVRRRWLMMAITLAVIAVPYAAIHRMIYAAFDFVRVPFDHAACGLEKNDLVLVTRGSYALEELDRGDVVAFVSTGNGRTRARQDLILELDTRGSVIGRIEALPHETVEISPAGLRLHPEFPDSTAVPLPGLPMPVEPATLQVPESHVLIPVPIQLPRGSIADAAVTDIWTKMFTVGPDDIQGRALLVYQPFWRRHVIRAPRESSRE